MKKNNNEITITQEQDTTIGVLKDILSSLPDDASFRIDDNARIHIGNMTNEDVENFANAQEEKLHDNELANTPSIDDVEAVFNDLKPMYNPTEMVHLDYDPTIYDGHHVILDNVDTELMVANCSPALYNVAREIRSKNEVISDIMAKHAKAAAKDMLEYMTQCIVNAADASTFDGEMRTMCRIIDKEK